MIASCFLLLRIVIRNFVVRIDNKKHIILSKPSTLIIWSCVCARRFPCLVPSFVTEILTAISIGISRFSVEMSQLVLASKPPTWAHPQSQGPFNQPPNPPEKQRIRSRRSRVTQTKWARIERYCSSASAFRKGFGEARDEGEGTEQNSVKDWAPTERKSERELQEWSPPSLSLSFP